MSNRRMKLEPAQEATLLRRYNRRCLACGTRRNIQIDHVVAVASGGADAPRNAQLLCGRCNKRKNDKTIDYRGWRGAWPLRAYRRLNNLGLPMKTIAQFCMRAVLVALAVLVVLPIAHPIQLAMLAWVTSMIVFVQSVAWLALAGGVLIAATWVYSNMQMEAPDEHGQWRLPRSYLRKHPEVALRTNQQHQQIRIVQARYQVPHHYAPKFAAPVEAEQVELVSAPMPLHTWFPTLAQHPAHVLLLGDTGSGKSTLARAMLAERAKTDKVLVLDPHANLNDWCGVPTYGDGRNFDEIERMIRTLHAEFERRFVPGADMGEPLTIFVDEMPAIADDNKAVIPMITKWLREGRKVGIRVCMLSQGGEVRTLGIEGQGSIRENFLFVRMGAFARGVEGIEPGTPYPAALVRGYRSDDPPAPLDTAGLTSLPLEVLPASVAWLPDPALLPSITTDTGLDSGVKVAQNNSNTTAERVLELLDSGKSMRAVQIEVFGYAGGAAHDKLQAILQKEGRS